MALSHRKCQESYQNALDALSKIIASPSATTAQTRAAEAAFDELNDNWINSKIEEVTKRTRKFQSFVEAMETVVAKIGSDSRLKGIQLLKQVVDDANAILGESV